MCKNRGIYGLLGPSWVLITYIICPPGNSFSMYEWSLTCREKSKKIKKRSGILCLCRIPIFIVLKVCLDCHHGLAIQRVSAPPCHTGREGGRHNQRNTGSHAARSRGRRVLSIPDSPEAAPGASVAAGFTFQVKNQASHWPITSLDKKKKKVTRLGLFWSISCLPGTV